MTEVSGSPPQGRAAQLETIRRALATAENGSTVSVLVEGEPGIGRSAVLAEMSQLARERGFAVVHCGCDPYEQRREYAVARHLLGEMSGSSARLLSATRAAPQRLDSHDQYD